MQKIEWLEADCLESGAGHGVEFFLGHPNGKPVLAFLHEFRWHHEPGHDVQVSIIRPSDKYPEELLEKLKERITAGLQAGRFDEQVMGNEFTTMFNA